VRDIDRGPGVDDIRVLEALNDRIEDLEDLEIAALVDENWFDGLDNAEDLATVFEGGSSTYRAAAFAEIQVAIQHAAVEIFLSGSRDLTRFTDSAGRVWLMTGGPTWGDPPTDSCDAVRMLDHIGISKRRIEQVPNLEGDEFSDDHPGEAINVLEEIAEGLRGEWTQGHLEVIADKLKNAGFDTESRNRYTQHNEDRGANCTVPGKDWGCR